MPESRGTKMPAYPNSFGDFIKELREDDTGEAISANRVQKEMLSLMDSLNTDFSNDVLEEVLGLKFQPDSTDPKYYDPQPIDYIEAAFRTLALNLFPGPSYKPVKS